MFAVFHVANNLIFLGGDFFFRLFLVEIFLDGLLGRGASSDIVWYIFSKLVG